MSKKSLILLSSIFFINLVSAQSIITDFFDKIDQTTLTLSVAFLIFFAIINYSLTKVMFRANPKTGNIVALGIAILAVYGLYKFDFALNPVIFFDEWFWDDLAYNIGLTGDFLYWLIPILIIGLFFIVGFKKGFGGALIFLGVFFMILSGFSYEQMTLWIMAIICMVLGLLISFRGEAWTGAEHATRIGLTIGRFLYIILGVVATIFVFFLVGVSFPWWIGLIVIFVLMMYFSWFRKGAGDSAKWSANQARKRIQHDSKNVPGFRIWIILIGIGLLIAFVPGFIDLFLDVLIRGFLGPIVVGIIIGYFFLKWISKRTGTTHYKYPLRMQQQNIPGPRVTP